MKAAIRWLWLATAIGCVPAQTPAWHQDKRPLYERQLVAKVATTAVQQTSWIKSCKDVQAASDGKQIAKGARITLAESQPDWATACGYALGYSDEARWEYVTDKAYFRLADLDHPTKIDPSIFTTGKPGVDYGFVAALPYDGSGYWAAFMNATRLSDGANVTLEDGEPAIEISADHQLLARKSGDVVLLPGGRTPIVRMVADYAAERAHYQHCQKWRSQDAPPPLPAPLALASSPKEFRGELFSATLDHEVQAIPQHDGSVLYVYSEAGTSVALRGPTKLADALSQGWSHIIVRPTGAIVDLKLQKAVELDVVAIVDPVLCWHEVGLVDCTYTAGQYELPRH